MTDFPRGWTLSSLVAPAGTASITVPATPGVVHVLDSFTAVLTAIAAAAAGFAVLVQSGAVVFGELAFAGGAFGVDTAALSGMDFATAPGAALTVAFSSAAPANYNELLIIQGHDI